MQKMENIFCEGNQTVYDVIKSITKRYTDFNTVQRFLHVPFSCLESQWRSSQPWRGRVECKELESCGPKIDHGENLHYNLHTTIS